MQVVNVWFVCACGLAHKGDGAVDQGKRGGMNCRTN